MPREINPAGLTISATRGRDCFMSRCSICLLLVVIFCVGCNRETRKRSEKPAVRPLAPIQLAVDAEYYTTLPPQGRPPDGTFPAGSEVSVMVTATNEAGPVFIGPDGEMQGFLLVQTGDGFEGIYQP